MNIASPAPLGLKKSFGFGDRLGLATPGHFAAARKFDFAPVFAQQSIREMERTQRPPQNVIQALTTALRELGYKAAWSADADHLKLPEHIDRAVAAGFCFFTIDPSEYVGKGVLTNAVFKPRIMEAPQQHAALHEELLDRHFTKHLSLLTKG